MEWVSEREMHVQKERKKNADTFNYISTPLCDYISYKHYITQSRRVCRELLYVPRKKKYLDNEIKKSLCEKRKRIISLQIFLTFCFFLHKQYVPKQQCSMFCSSHAWSYHICLLLPSSPQYHVFLSSLAHFSRVSQYATDDV